MNRERRLRNERRADIAALVAALDDAANYRIGFEVLRAARLVPGWALKRGTPGLFEIDCPGRPGLRLNRDDTLAILRSRWLPAARAEIGAQEPDVTDGITEAAKMEAEPAFDDGATPNSVRTAPSVIVKGCLALIDETDDAMFHIDAAGARRLRDDLDTFLRGAP